MSSDIVACEAALNNLVEAMALSLKSVIDGAAPLHLDEDNKDEQHDEEVSKIFGSRQQVEVSTHRKNEVERVDIEVGAVFERFEQLDMTLRRLTDEPVETLDDQIQQLDAAKMNLSSQFVAVYEESEQLAKEIQADLDKQFEAAMKD